MQYVGNITTGDLDNWSGLLGGDKECLARLYKTYFNPLYNYGKKICTDSTKVEDGIHDLFVDLWKYRQNLTATTSVRFYLYRSLRRRLVKENITPFSFSDHQFQIEETLRMSCPSSENEIIDRESKDAQTHRLKKLLSDLSPRQYEAMVLYFYDEFTYEEIGSILHVNEQSARNLVQRGLIQLRQYAKLLVCYASFLLVF